MRTITTMLVIVGPGSACQRDGGSPVDTDGDGLNDGMEVGIGSDPLDADSDDDGLLDGEEVDLGTWWLDPDTDDDGYSDRDEHHEGKDPLDANSVIYRGGWPYYFEKTELKGGGVYEIGKRFANFEFEDQFGDTVSLWDFYNDDTYVIVDLCAGWHPTCVNLSRWIAGERGDIFDPWLDVAYAVDAGELYWITVLAENEVFEPATPNDIFAWADEQPHDLVPVLADPDAESYTFVELVSFPTLVLLSPDLEVHVIADPPGWYTSVLDATLEILDP